MEGSPLGCCVCGVKLFLGGGNRYFFFGLRSYYTYRAITGGFLLWKSTVMGVLGGCGVENHYSPHLLVLLTSSTNNTYF